MPPLPTSIPRAQVKLAGGATLNPDQKKKLLGKADLLAAQEKHEAALRKLAA